MMNVKEKSSYLLMRATFHLLLTYKLNKMKDMTSKSELAYSFKHRTNPSADDTEQFIINVIKTHYGFLETKVIWKYLNTGIGHCAGCAYPKASFDELKVITPFFTYLFLIDDKYEHSSLEEIEEVERITMLALRNGELSSSDPLFAQLLSVRNDLLRVGGQRWIEERICPSLGLYFKGIKEAIGYRVKNVFPSMGDFYEIRVNDVNVWPMLNFAELITGVVLPNKVINHPLVSRLGILTSRILSWANDYFSAHQEDGKEVFNLALMIKHYSNCSVNEANAELIKIHDADVREFETTIDCLPDFGQYNAPLMEYVDNLRLMIAGYLHWTLQLTARYKAGGHPSMDIRMATALA